jgi:hypothetical protein
VVRVVGKVDWESRREDFDIQVERQREREEDRQRQEIEDRKRAVGFPASPVLTGEDPAQFDRLLKDLVFEFQPEGPAQLDAVRTMACAIWRKQNLGIFQRAAEARMRWGHYFRHPNDQGGFIKIILEQLQAATVETERLVQAATVKSETGDCGETRGETPTGSQSNNTDTKVQNQTKSEAKPFVIYSDVQASMQIYEVTKKIDDAGRKVFGRPTPESAANATYVSDQIALAMQGDLLTPECYLAELRMVGELDRVIERSHARLMKRKASKSRPTTPLIPAWVARRR